MMRLKYLKIILPLICFTSPWLGIMLAYGQKTNVNVHNGLSTEDKSVSLEHLLKQSEALYGEGEKDRREGYLWVDRKSSKYVVTLGAVHGLRIGDTLWVYRNQSRMGQVAIEVVFDIISYVQPVNASTDLSTYDYYEVAVE